MEIDCRDRTVREINRTLKEAAISGEKEIILKNPGAKHFLCAGLQNTVNVIVDGSAGYFVGTMIEGARVIVEKNAGWFAGDNMTAGYLEIKGNAGDGAGQGIYGGTIVIRGNAGARTGEIMKNGTIIVGGNSEFMTGLYMMGGKIVILGNLSDMAGESIVRGEIYVKGEIKSLGQNAKISKLTKNDKTWLKKTLKEHNFKSAISEFRKIVPEKSRFYYAPSEEG